MTSVALLMSACAPTPTAEPDRVATRVAEDLAVAQTLTAVAQAAVAPPPTMPALAASPTLPLPPPNASPTNPPPPTQPPTRPRPIDTPLPEDPTVPGFGTPKGLNGRIVLPGYSGHLEPPVFKDSIVFKLVVFDPDRGSQDGEGIQAVRFEAFDPLGNTVIEQRESNPAYCAFGNPADSPHCEVWRFSEHNFTWPNGTPACAGSGYSVNMVVETDDPAKNEANWGFEFAVESPDGSLPNCF